MQRSFDGLVTEVDESTRSCCAADLTLTPKTATIAADVRSPVVFSLAFLSTAVHTNPAESLEPPSRLIALAQPSPLDADEEASSELARLARRFNPAMALPIREVWPVEVGYAWHEGADLVARVEHPDGRVDERAVLRGAELGRRDWSHLPAHTPAGTPIRYYIDAPGDDELDENGVSLWRRRFAKIAGANEDGAAPAKSAYPPTQYVHAFWWNRARGLLAVQYWFYYPFNEWVNHHEGDWEHIQIVLGGPSRLNDAADFTPVAHHYFFHDFWTEPAQVRRFAGADDGDHPLVYVGGRGEWFGYDGMMSGGSYPGPGRFPAAAFHPRWLSPAEDTSQPARFIAAEDFRLIVLPEPARLDAARFPELSWLRLPFYIGQREVTRNLPGTANYCGRPPLQPAARAEWRGPPPFSAWRGEVGRGRAAPEAHRWPSSWRCAAAAADSSCSIATTKAH